MNILLIFFAIPLAVIIFSIALQKIFKCTNIFYSDENFRNKIENNLLRDLTWTVSSGILWLALRG